MRLRRGTLAAESQPRVDLWVFSGDGGVVRIGECDCTGFAADNRVTGRANGDGTTCVSRLEVDFGSAILFPYENFLLQLCDRGPSTLHRSITLGTLK